MPKAVRLASTFPASFGPSSTNFNQSDYSQFFPVALFSGIGLLVSLVAMLCGVQGAWF